MLSFSFWLGFRGFFWGEGIGVVVFGFALVMSFGVVGGDDTDLVWFFLHDVD